MGIDQDSVCSSNSSLRCGLPTAGSTKYSVVVFGYIFPASRRACEKCHPLSRYRFMRTIRSAQREYRGWKHHRAYFNDDSQFLKSRGRAGKQQLIGFSKSSTAVGFEIRSCDDAKSFVGDVNHLAIGIALMI